MPYVREAFAHLGEVRTYRPREVTADGLRDVEVLLVRSVTKVTPELLDDTAVRFVGTATIGTDHIDVDYLKRRGIAFASAPGCNADSVGEWMTAVLLWLAKRRGWRLADKTLGVVGVGNVGSRVVRRARALGMHVLENDPPLARATGDRRFVPIDAILEADVATLHVPLEKGGPDPTWHLANAAFLRRMNKGSVLVNASRGAVVDGRALAEALDNRTIDSAVLDVWEGEPRIDLELLGRVGLATSHIAGYSFDGRVNGTEITYRAVCAFLGVEPTWDRASAMPAPDVPLVEVDAPGRDPQDVMTEVIERVYDITADDARLRRIVDLPDDQRGPYFDNLRLNYPKRREFPNTQVVVDGGTETLRQALTELTFRVTDADPT